MVRFIYLFFFVNAATDGRQVTALQKEPGVDAKRSVCTLLRTAIANSENCILVYCAEKR